MNRCAGGFLPNPGAPAVPGKRRVLFPGGGGGASPRPAPAARAGDPAGLARLSSARRPPRLEAWPERSASASPETAGEVRPQFIDAPGHVAQRHGPIGHKEGKHVGSPLVCDVRRVPTVAGKGSVTFGGGSIPRRCFRVKAGPSLTRIVA